MYIDHDKSRNFPDSFALEGGKKCVLFLSIITRKDSCSVSLPIQYIFLCFIHEFGGKEQDACWTKHFEEREREKECVWSKKEEEVHICREIKVMIGVINYLSNSNLWFNLRRNDWTNESDKLHKKNNYCLIDQVIVLKECSTPWDEERRRRRITSIKVEEREEWIWIEGLVRGRSDFLSMGKIHSSSFGRIFKK